MLKLTNKCKKDFEIWLLSAYDDKDLKHKESAMKFFNDAPDFMKWGVILNFADIEGYFIEDGFEYDDDFGSEELDFTFRIKFTVGNIGKVYNSDYFKLRKDSQEMAVKTFNELYNENNT